MPLVLLLIFGFAPSFIWLLFYLRRDRHPESNAMVLQIFLWGMMIAPLALILEMILTLPFASLMPGDIQDILEQPLWLALIIVAVIPALAEEYLKYQVVKQKVLNTSHFDEPLDTMLYFVITALGFAAVENFSQAFRLYLDGHSYSDILWIILARFVGATLLHTLSSGIFGYFIALSLGQLRTKMRLWGFGFAWLVHFCYNGMLVFLEKSGSYLESFDKGPFSLNYFLLSPTFFWTAAIVLFLVVLAIVNLALFRKLKDKASVCQLSHNQELVGS